jgi:putative transposase
MPDHIHMLVKLGPENDLSHVMKLFKGRTSLKINRALKRTGSVWYKGFHDHLIRPEEPLKNFIKYIIHNPVKKGLAKNPSEYPYLLIKTDMCERL